MRHHLTTAAGSNVAESDGGGDLAGADVTPVAANDKGPDPTDTLLPDLGRFATVGEAAARLSIGRRTLYDWIRQGRFPAVRLGGTYRIPAAILQLWITDNLQSASATQPAERVHLRRRRHPDSRPDALASIPSDSPAIRLPASPPDIPPCSWPAPKRSR